jgi:hypothetical protein
MTTCRTYFNQSWLTETPMGTGAIDSFDSVAYNIKDLIRYDMDPVPVSDNIWKIELSQTVYYWIGSKTDIQLATELSKTPQALVVKITGKDPKYKGKPPFASTLYSAILHDTDSSIRIMSDTQLSDEGYSIWKRLFTNGFKISVYDSTDPGKSFNTFNDITDFDKFFKHSDASYKRYQYVLSSDKSIAETRSHFHTRRYRELSGLDLED